MVSSLQKTKVTKHYMRIKDYILFEDNHLLVINKPPGVLVQGDRTGDDSLLTYVEQYIVDTYKKPGRAFVGLPHRLDRPTSGIVILCKTSKSLSRMSEIFRKGSIKKTYWALASGVVESDGESLEHFVFKDQEKNRSRVVKKLTGNAKLAKLSFTIVQRLQKYSLAEVSLETGRHHQIRVQFAAIGHPLKGDVKYGARRGNKDGSIGLHARSVSFIHPVTKEPVQVTADPKSVSMDSIWTSLKY